MSTLMNVDVSLKEVVEEIEKGNFLIPNFQRGFVWKTPDVSSLGDSIVRGYPISSMLTMPANGTLKVTATPLKTSGAHANYGQNANYVLDGQQRITSLAKLFLGYDEEREYYFDMLSILNDKFPNHGIDRIPSIQGRSSSKVTEELCRPFKKPNGSTTDSRQNFRFIRGNDIVQNRFGSAVTRFLRGFEGVNEDTIYEYTDYLNAVFGAMGGYGIPFTKINADSDLGLVIRVFEKVNTSGKKLTLFDLVNAKSFESANPSYQIGLADFITESLRIAAKNPEYRTSAIEFFFKKPSGEPYSDLAPFIRCASIASYLANGQMPNLSNKEMLEKEADFWFDAWQSHSATLLKFISKIDQEGILKLINGTLLEYVAAIVMANPRLLNEPIFTKEVKRYALDLILSNQTFNKSNMDVVMEFFNLGKHIVESHEFEKHKHGCLSYTTVISADRIEQWGMDRQQFKAIMYILYSERLSGKFTVDLGGNPIKISNIADMDQHHLYPKARTKRGDESIYNSVANIVILDRTCNQHEIKDKKPFDYLRELSVVHGDQAKYIFSQNLIPDAMWNNEDSDPVIVLKERLNLITDLVNNYFLKGAACSTAATSGPAA